MSEKQTTAAPPDLMGSAALMEYRRIRNVLHSQCVASGRREGARLPAGDYAARAAAYRTTVGDIARAVQLPAERVAAHLRDAYLVILSEKIGQPVELWEVEEDGQ